MRMIPAIGLVSAALCGACQTYQTVPPNELVPQNTIRVTLTDAGRTQLASAVGPHVEAIAGVLMARDTTGLTMRVTTIRRTDGPDEVYQNTTPVIVPNTAVESVALRRVDVTRSLLTAGAIAGGAIAVGSSAGGGGARRTGGSGGGQNNPQ